MQDLVSMDLSQERKMVTRKESGQADGCHDHHQPAGIVTEEATEKVNIIIHQKASSTSSLTMEEKYASLKNALNETTQSPNPLIQRVPYMLRDHKNFEKYYEPRVVAIGPLHHGRKPHLQTAEQLKRRLAALFVNDSGLDTHFLYNKIWTEIAALRERFDPEETKSFTDEQLAWMLFVDGCAVLHLIKCRTQKTLNKLKIKDNQIALIWQDLFLLENQIPFRVLELLTNFDSVKKQQWQEDIDTFVTMNTGSRNPSQEESPVHLLHLFRANLLPDPEIIASSPRLSNSENPPPITTSSFIPLSDYKNPPSDSKNPPSITSPSLPLSHSKNPPSDSKTPPPITSPSLPLSHSKNPPSDSKTPPPITSPALPPPHSNPPLTSPPKITAEKDRGWHIFRNVKDLKSAGIIFECSHTHSLKHISFTSGCFVGKLTLPVISVDDSTGPKFMNLIAYEMCPDYDNDFAVTSYVCFIDSLVDQAEDVQELRKARILLNFLGSDEEVAQLFNEISIDLVPNSNAYKIVKKSIEKHCENRWKTWMAQAYHDHFSSPWTIVAFLGAVVAIVLTGIQTWFGVFPRNNDSQPCPCPQPMGKF